MKVKEPLAIEQLVEQREKTEALLHALSCASTLSDKIAVLDRVELEAKEEECSEFSLFLQELTPEKRYVAQAALALGQRALFTESAHSPTRLDAWKALVGELVDVEEFYAPVGGLVGYQHLVLGLLLRQEKEEGASVALYPPHKVDLTQEDETVRQAIVNGIRAQGKLAEMYPVGGAADRLQLIDEATQERLPAARLVFLGKHLLEGVIRDLQAREYLAFSLYGEQVTTPVVMMTSDVNDNAMHIRAICSENDWFGRPQDSFRFFRQPSVPTFTREGKWCLNSPSKLLVRPGGHGAIWTLALREGVMDWLDQLGKEKILVRQINNPMGGIDSGLLAFLGVGWQRDQVFGFASCPRLIDAQEGMNVVKVTTRDGKEHAVLTNIEYCDFARFGIEDEADAPGGRTSVFPSNTNILFADLKAAIQAVKDNPFPGLLLNFRVMEHMREGTVQHEPIARLEATMQNLADAFTTVKDSTKPPAKGLAAYLTFNKRRKTISTAKRKSNPNGALIETPDGCYYDFLQNAHELLENYCGISLPPPVDEETFKRNGPSFLLSYHPALGPLYSIIGQKIQGGVFEPGAELHLEIADVEIANLHLKGSLLIRADAVMGHLDDKAKLCYSHRTGQCILRHVRVENNGIDWSGDHLFWKHDVQRAAAFTLILHGHSQFVAEDVTLQGDQVIEVPDGVRMRAYEKEGEVVFRSEPLNEKKPFWSYSVTPDYHLLLSRGQG